MNEAAVTENRLLNGRVRYTQPRDGLRAGIAPVLLAAAIPARPGERVLEAGTGPGAALLCLAARIPGIVGIGLERDPALTALARHNAAVNGFSDLLFAVADILASPISGPIDHGFANPPFHAESGTRSPSDRRELAKRGSQSAMSAWVEALARPLRHRGTLTLILPSWPLDTILSALREHGTPAERIVPLWPRAGRAAGLMIVQGRKGGRSPLELSSGMVLHRESGAFTPEADRILRDAGSLPAEAT